MTTTNDEQGLIPFGTIMRKLRIDKLPQLINVFIGELSFVGPPPVNTNQTKELPHWYRERFYTTPGFVGLYKTVENNKHNYDEIMRVDIRYVHHQSFWLDIKVLKNRAIETFSEINYFLLSPSVYIRSKPCLDSFLAIFGLIIFSR